MAITEQSRKQLYQRLEEVLGDDPAATLMEHLPPVGWADVATKHDLEHLRASLTSEIEHLRQATGLRFDQVDRRFDDIDRRFDDMERRFVTKGEFYRVTTAQMVTIIIVMCTLAATGRFG